jgi:hypothetical protein
MPISIMFKTLSRAALVAAFAITGPIAIAADEANTTGIRWACTQQDDEYFHIQCVPRPTPPGEQASEPGAPTGGIGDGSASKDGSSPVETITAPGGQDMRPVALRGAAEVFSARAWRLPLYTRPTNQAAIARLLQMVLCGTVPYCSVAYGAG